MVVVKVDQHDQSGHTNRGMLGIVVGRTNTRSNAVIVAMRSGVLCTGINWTHIYWSTNKYTVLEAATLTPDLEEILDAIQEQGNL